MEDSRFVKRWVALFGACVLFILFWFQHAFILGLLGSCAVLLLRLLGICAALFLAALGIYALLLLLFSQRRAIVPAVRAVWGWPEARRRERDGRQQRIAADPRNREVLDLQRFAAPDLMLRPEPTQFEEFVLRYFRLLGYAAEGTPASGDRGVDGILRRGGQVYLVQCKRWEASVGEPELRDLLGAVTKHGAAGGIFVTTSKFTPRAREFAQGTPIELIDGETLSTYIKALQVSDPAARPIGTQELVVARPIQAPVERRPLDPH